MTGATIFDSSTGVMNTIGGGVTQNKEDRLDALGGGIEVNSAPGKGTRLLSRLPAMAAAV